MSHKPPTLKLPEELEVESQLVDDGRNVDQSLGTLSGEAAEQTPLASRLSVALQSQSYPYVPSRPPEGTPTYYDAPMLKEPVWSWSIPTYFYVGGVAGVSATFGAAAQLFAPSAMRSLIVRSRWVATVGGAVSAALLIEDLGRPARFLNMLRVFRVTSPMSMGSWILTIFSTAVGGAAILPLGPRIFRPLAEALGLVAGLFGLGLSGYTGVLLSQTTVPVWQECYRTMPLLFLASGTAASAAVFEFFRLNKPETKAVERFGFIGKILEVLAAQALEAEANRVQRVAKPLKSGFSGFLWQGAKALTVTAIVLTIIPGESRGKRIASGIVGTAASLFLRFGIFHAGKFSARDPRASFESQRVLATRKGNTGLLNQDVSEAAGTM